VKRQLVARHFRGTRGIAIKIRIGRKLRTNLLLTLAPDIAIYAFSERCIDSLIKQVAESEISRAPSRVRFDFCDDSHSSLSSYAALK